MAGKRSTLGPQPLLQVGDERRYDLAASRSAMGVPLMARSASKITSMRLTASGAIGEMTAAPLRRFSWLTTSASSKNLRLACAQHRARMTGDGERSERNRVL